MFFCTVPISDLRSTVWPQTQEKSLYPKLLSLLRPYSPPSSANILGWHAEGPYLQFAKRGAHAPPFLLTAPEGYKSVEKLYGAENLADAEDWLMNQGVSNEVGVRIITAAPEVEGVMESISELTKKGIIFSIGHRFVETTFTFGERFSTNVWNL
jgi:N-acetylglucosamine-6-phosphate deacetylase